MDPLEQSSMPARVEEQPAGSAGATKCEVDTLATMAVGVIAWIAFAVLHEVVGHAGVAAILGEDVRGLATTTAHIHDFYEIDSVTDRIGEWGFRLVCAGGFLMNFFTALLALVLLASGRVKSPSFRYFLWLFSTVSIVQQSFWMTVLPFSGLGGDWVAFLEGLDPAVTWKIILTAIGLTLFVVGMKLPFHLWHPILPIEAQTRRRCIRRLTLVPMAAAFVVQSLSVLWAPLSWSRYGMLITIATFLPIGIWLLVVSKFRRWPTAQSPDSTLRIGREASWLTAAIVLSILFIAWLGPGIGSFEGHPQYVGQ
jgi:hypothetical protein